MIDAIVENFVNPLAEATYSLMFAICFNWAKNFNNFRRTYLVYGH